MWAYRGSMKLSQEVLIVVLIVLLAVGGLTLRNFPFSDGDLDKDMPPTITSFDLFAGTSWTKWIHDSEDARYNQPYRVMNVRSVTVQPVYYFLFIATMTKLTTIPSYQTTQFLTHLSSMLVILMFFILVRRFLGWKVALISTTIAAFPAAKWMFQMYIGFQYDQYAFLFVPISMFFLISFFNKEFDNRQTILAGILLGFFAVTMWLSHFVELFFYAPLLIALWIYFAWKERFAKKYWVIALIALLVFIPYVVYFFPITGQGHLAGGLVSKIDSLVNLGTFSPYPDYWPHPRFDTWLNILGFLGLFFLGYKAYKREWDTKQTLTLILLLYVVAIGFSNYIGIDANRAGRQLFNGLAVLAVFPAVGLYLVYSFVTAKLKRLSIPIFLLLIGFLVFSTASTTFADLNAIDQGAFVDDAKWESIDWIKTNTPEDSLVFYLNGFYHEFAMLGERAFSEGIVLPNPESMEFNLKHLCSGNWTPVYAGHWGNAEFAFATGEPVYIKERVGWNKFTYQAPFDYPEAKEAFNYSNVISYVPLTFFDYVVVEHQGTQFDPCMGFFLQQSTEKGHKIVWNNNRMAILKINKEAQP